jgi:streptogramin lyase
LALEDFVLDIMPRIGFKYYELSLKKVRCVDKPLKIDAPRKSVALMKTACYGSLISCGILAASVCGGFSQPYTFRTAAGLAGQEATVAETGDGTNQNARFFSPYGVALDNQGNLYVADGNAIRKVAPSGTNWVVTTLAGQGILHGMLDGTNDVALFDNPQGIAVDATGNLYVADTANNSIRRVTPIGTNWVVTTVAGSGREFPGSADGTNTYAKFNGPNDIAADTAGNLYVADTLNSTIRKITPVGTNWVSTTLAGLAGTSGSADGTNSVARFDNPAALVLDTNGNVYVADYANDTIRKLTPMGTNWVVSTPAGLAATSGAADGTNSQARFNGPLGIALGGGGNLYVSDSGNSTIRKVKPVGTNWVVSTLAGSPGQTGSADGTGAAALFSQPYGIAVDQGFNLYVADSPNYTIRRGNIAAWMQIALTANHVVLSWPAALTGYVAEASSTLSVGPWSTNTNTLSISGDYVTQTNNLQGGSRYFRLHKP